MDTTSIFKILFTADTKGYDEGLLDMKGATLRDMEIIKMSFEDMTRPLIEFGNEAIQSAASFESSMANVSTLLDGGVKQVNEYKDAILDMTLRVPQSADELANGLYQVVSAGVATGDAMAFLESSAKAAIGGMSNTFTAVDAGTSIMNAFNMTAKDTDKIFGLMQNTVKLGKISFEQLAQGVGMVAPAASAAGVKIEDMFASLATATLKLQPQIAITALSGAISEMNTPASKAEKALKKLGYESLQAALKENSLSEVMIKLVNSGEKIDAIFGREAARAVNAVGQSAEKATAHVAAMQDTSTASAEAYKKASDTYENAVQMEINARQKAMIQLGNEMIPAEKAYLDAKTELWSAISGSSDAMKTLLGASIETAKGISKLSNLLATGGRNITAMRDGYKMVKDTMKDVHKITDLLRLTKTKEIVVTEGATVATQTQTVAVKGLGAAMKTAMIALAALMVGYEILNKIVDQIEKGIDRRNKAMSGGVDVYKEEIDIIQKAQDELKKTGKITTDVYKQRLADAKILSESEQKLSKSEQLLILENAKNHRKTRLSNIQLETQLQEIQTKTSEQGIEWDQKRLDAIELEGSYTDKLNAKIAYGNELLSKQGTTAKGSLDILKAKIRELGSIGGDVSQYTDEFFAGLTDDKKIAAAIKQVEKAITSIRKKAIEDREKILDDLAAKHKKSERDLALDSIKEDTNAYYDLKIKQENEDFDRLFAANLKDNEMLESIAKDHSDTLLRIQFDRNAQLKSDDEKAKADKKAADDKAIADAKLYADTQIGIYGEMITAAMSFAEVAGGGFETAALKESLKQMLLAGLGYLERKYILSQGMSFLESIFNPLSSTKNIPALIAGEAAIMAARAAIASFATGTPYVPQDMIAQLHKGERVVSREENITQNYGAQSIAFQVDGKTFAEVAINGINNANRELGTGRSVIN